MDQLILDDETTPQDDTSPISMKNCIISCKDIF